MKRTLPLLALLLLPGCMIPAGVAATAWATVKTAANIVRVVQVLVPNKENSMKRGLCDGCGLPKPQRYMGYGIMLCAQCEDEQAHRDAAQDEPEPEPEESGNDGLDKTIP